MEYPNDEWKPSADDAYDPAVDDAIAKHKVEAPDAYDNTGVSSRPSRSSRPQLTEGVLRDMRRHRGGGAGYSGSTPINPQQLKSEAQTRDFFAGKKNQAIDPYSDANQTGISRIAPKSAEALLNTRGSQTENQARSGMLDDIYSKYGDKSIDPKISSALGMYDTQNDTEEDKRVNQSGEGISHTTQRWTEKLKGIPEYDNGDFGKAYKKQVDNFVAQNPAYKNQLTKGGYSGFQVKEIDPYQIMEQVMLDNQSSTKPKTDSQGIEIPTTNRLQDQLEIDDNNPDTWTQGRDVGTAEKAISRDKRLQEPSEYYSEKRGKWIKTNSFDQPKHTDVLARLAFKNQDLDAKNGYLNDLKNSIRAELISQANVASKKGMFFENYHQTIPHTANISVVNNYANPKIVDKMAEDLLEIQYYKHMLKSGQSKTLQRSPEQIQAHLINLKNRYNKTKENANILSSQR